MDFKNLLALSKAAMSAKPEAPVAFSCEVDGKVENFSSSELNNLLRSEFEALTEINGTFNYALYKQNQPTIFQIISETIDEILPRRVESQYAQFADTTTIAQGDKAVFKLKITESARRRAKTFVTRVGLAGRYESFMLEGAEMEVQTGAVGAAAKIGMEEFLDGRFEFADFTEIIVEALDEFIYQEIAKALVAMVETLPTANKAVESGFDETTMDELLAIADSFGPRAAIYCTQEFANKMIPSDSRMSNEMKNNLWTKGWLGDYKGHQVLIMDQSILWGTPEVNSTKVIDPSMAYIIPLGTTKPIKIVFEGQTQVRGVENDDWSRDLQTYTKVGVGTVAALGGITWICSYKNTELSLPTRS